MVKGLFINYLNFLSFLLMSCLEGEGRAFFFNGVSNNLINNYSEKVKL